MKVIQLAPNEAGAYLNLANILHETGDVKSACDNWEKAFSLGANNAQQMLDKFCR